MRLTCPMIATTIHLGSSNARAGSVWIVLYFACYFSRNSPVRYPHNVYAGPPIPIDFSDSSFDEGSPEKAPR